MAVEIVVSADGRRVVELEAYVEGVVEEARELGAELVWVHTNDDLSAHGFRRAGAYVRMHADEVPVRKREPSFIEERDYADVLARAYAGLWGTSSSRRSPCHPTMRSSSVCPSSAYAAHGRPSG